MGRPTVQVVYRSTGHLVQLRELRMAGVASGGVLPSDTTSVYGTLVTSGITDGVNSGVSGASWPIAFTMVQSDTGMWEGSWPSSVALTLDERYQFLLTVDPGGGAGRLWKIPIQAKESLS